MASSFMEKAFPTLANRGKGKKKKGKNGNGPDTSALDEQKKGYKQKKPQLPQVDLLPPKLVLQVRQRQLKFGFFVAGMVIVILIVLAYLFQLTKIGVEDSGASRAEQQQAQAQAALQKFSPVTTYLQDVQKRKNLVEQIASNKVPYQVVLSTLGSGLPSGSFQSIDMKPNPAPAEMADAQQAFVNACGPKTNPFAPTTPPTAACVKISGTAPNRDSVNNLVSTLRSNPQYANVYVTQSPGGTSVAFQGSFTVLDVKAG